MPVRADDPAFLLFARTAARAAAPLVPDPAALGRLALACDLRRPGPGEHLLRAGEVARHVFFVAGGLLRAYHADEGGAERTEQFFDGGQAFTDAGSYLGESPAAQSIEALEPSVVLCLPRSALDAAFARDHAIERVGRLLVEEALMGMQRRATRLLTLSPEARYRVFVDTRPEVARRVPQYLVASYLGITPEALSRIRRRIARPR